MGLGGYLTWTALAREIYEKHGIKTIPVERHNSITKLISSPIFYNNPHFIQSFSGELGIEIALNNPATNYCELDSPQKAIHKSSKHIIETLCEPYGFKEPKLRCEIFLDEKELKEVDLLVSNLPKKFLTIEPHSNHEYTVNRTYPFEKWQRVVDRLSKKIPIVQVGMKNSALLKGVIDLRGKTSFRTAAGVIGKSKILLSSEGGLTHLATAVNTPAVVVLTGYQTKKMVAYPQNVYIDISSHGPCGMKIECNNCVSDAKNHDDSELSEVALNFLETAC